METVCQLWVLNRRDINFCVRSTLSQCGFLAAGKAQKTTFWRTAGLKWGRECGVCVCVCVWGGGSSLRELLVLSRWDPHVWVSVLSHRETALTTRANRFSRLPNQEHWTVLPKQTATAYAENKLDYRLHGWSADKRQHGIESPKQKWCVLIGWDKEGPN